MKIKLGIACIGAIEICLGAVTFIAVSASVLLGESLKPPAVVTFVLVSACLSLWLGAGVIRRALVPYRALLFFCAVIILSKILIFAKVISLHGALETTIPSSLKNAISLLYHAAVIVFLRNSKVRKEFEEG